ncbi:MAG: hypothetical protein KME20_09175 [Kaiparowitsia implicata GSE-PSE-MK54-09C]|jgi:hypothetical protein|nr:hypothetical protein [Kaiparowitsia implicata GSE-PSE-MK54-09C]
MAFWEFLIQKEGDRAWLPLESPDVEILEGRYRVVARTSWVNAPVEILITYEDLDEQPPKRRVQRRTGKTNGEGLIVVLPYVAMQPGRWELRCSGDLMAELMDQGWRHAVQVQVLPQDADVPEDWESDWHGRFDGSATDKAGESLIEASADESVTELAEPAPGLSTSRSTPNAAPEPVIVPHLADEPLTAAEVQAAIAAIEADVEAGSDTTQTAVHEAIAQTEEATAALPRAIYTARPEELRLTLDCDRFTARPEEAVTLTGNVALNIDADGLATLPTDLPAHLPPVALHIMVRDPQTGEIVVDVRRSLTSRQLPCPVSCSITLPPVSTSLLVGELALIHLADNDSTPIISHSFAILAELDQLLEAIANQAEQAASLDAADAAHQASLQVDETFLNLTLSPPPEGKLQVATNQVLPPQLYRPKSNPDAPRVLQLPTMLQAPVPPFAFSPFTAAPEPPSADSSGETSTPDAPAAAPNWDATPERVPAGDAAAQAKPVDEAAPDAVTADTATADTATADTATADEADATSTWAVFRNWYQSVNPADSIEQGPEGQAHSAPQPLIAQPLPTARRPAPLEVPPSPADQAFQSLKLSDRFLARLNDMAVDRELKRSLLSRPEATDWPAPQPAPSEPSALVKAAVLEDEAPPSLPESLRYVPPEIVLDDEAPLPTRYINLFRLQERSLDPVPTLLPADSPIPMPSLELPRAEMVAGDRIEVGARIPYSPSPMAVKFWLQDCQSRRVVDGPRWLMNLTPNAYGDLEGWATITVPYGCLDVEFGAIAVEVPSQRESHKVSQERKIIPADLPSLSLGDLGI